MKVAFNVKNISGAVRPGRNDVLLCDGTDWYVTTKDELLREDKELLESCRNKLASYKSELDETKAAFETFKSDVAAQLYEMSELIKQLYSK